MKTVSEKLCSFDAQGEIVCVQHTVDYTNFNEKSAPQMNKAHSSVGMKGIDEDKAIDPKIVSAPDAGAIVPPPNDTYNMDWKRYEKPLYPFALESTWGDKTIGYTSVPVSTSTWTSHAPRCPNFMSSQWEELSFDQNKF
jgi:hypothetical protein